MQPRSEPLLWLQCLALGAIPLELLLIRLVLAGADPGPVRGVARFLCWGVGGLPPAAGLWRRPADWASLLFVRQPLASRNSDQLRISASQGGLSSRAAVVIAAVVLLPVLWWMDDSAVLASEFSPVSGQSRLVTLLLVSPLLALMVWQVQQLIQAAALLLGSPATVAPADSAFRADAVATQRTSLGLQLLNLPGLEWPEPVVEPIKQEPDQAIGVEDTESETDNSTDQASTDNEAPDEEISADDPVTAAVSDEADPETAPEPVVAEAQADEESSDDAEEAAPTSDQDADEAMDVEDVEDTTQEPDDSTEDISASDISPDNEEPDDKAPDNQEPDGESSAINTATAEESDDVEPEALEPVDAEDQDDMSEDDEAEDISAVDADESSVAAAASVAVEPEQSGEEQESPPLDAEVSQID
ncbi:MAG: low-complexity tail membrane protein, partial [Cyanobacteriota bacterium]|nr:low-complexity tail membrane protein [Cyanobacteriota bacterium]